MLKIEAKLKQKVFFNGNLVSKVVVDVEHVNKGSGNTRNTNFKAEQVANEFIQIARRFGSRAAPLYKPTKVIKPFVYFYCINFIPSFAKVNYFMKFVYNKKYRSVYIITMYCRPLKDREEK